MGQIFSSSSTLTSKDESSRSGSSTNGSWCNTSDVATATTLHNKNRNQLELHELIASCTIGTTTNTCHSQFVTTTINHQKAMANKKKKKFDDGEDDDESSTIRSGSNRTCDDTIQLSFDDSSFSSSYYLSSSADASSKSSESSSTDFPPAIRIRSSRSTVQDGSTGVDAAAAATAAEAAQQLTDISTHTNTAELMLVHYYFYCFAATTTTSSSSTTESSPPPPQTPANSRYHHNLLPMAVSHLTEAAKSIAGHLYHNFQNNQDSNGFGSGSSSDNDNNLNGGSSSFLHSALLFEWYRVYYNAMWISNHHHHHHSMESSEEVFGARREETRKEFNNTATAGPSPSSSLSAAVSSPTTMGSIFRRKNTNDRSFLKCLEAAAFYQSIGGLFVWLGDHRLALHNFHRAKRLLLNSSSRNTAGMAAAVAPLRTIVPCLINITYSYFALNDYVQTIEAGKQALKWIRILELSSSSSSTTTTMARATDGSPSRCSATVVAGRQRRLEKEELLAHHLCRVIGRSYERMGDIDTAETYYNAL